MTKHNDYKMRHLILETLVDRSKSSKGKGNVRVKEISLTIEEIAKKIKCSIDEIRPQLDILASREHIYGNHQNNEYTIIAEGGDAYHLKTHLEEKSSKRFEQFKRTATYITIPLAILSTVLAISSNIRSYNQANEMKELRTELKGLHTQLEEQKINKQNRIFETIELIQKQDTI